MRRTISLTRLWMLALELGPAPAASSGCTGTSSQSQESRQGFGTTDLLSGQPPVPTSVHRAVGTPPPLRSRCSGSPNPAPNAHTHTHPPSRHQNHSLQIISLSSERRMPCPAPGHRPGENTQHNSGRKCHPTGHCEVQHLGTGRAVAAVGTPLIFLALDPPVFIFERCSGREGR